VEGAADGVLVWCRPGALHVVSLDLPRSEKQRLGLLNTCVAGGLLRVSLQNCYRVFLCFCKLLLQTDRQFCTMLCQESHGQCIMRACWRHAMLQVVLLSWDVRYHWSEAHLPICSQDP
jgi:hypothetical protein